MQCNTRLIVIALATAFCSSASFVSAQAPTVRPRNITREKTQDRIGDAATAQKIVVAAIGVEKYRHAPPLEFSNDDAEMVVKAFREVAQLSPEQTPLLTDQNGPHTGPDILKKLANQLNRVGPAGTFILFFSGHGFQDSSGKLYLATAEFDPHAPETTGIPVTSLRELLAKSRAGTKLVFLDACYSGGFASPVDGTELANAFKSIAGTASVASSSKGQASLEVDELRHGLFTYWLVRGMRGEANSKVDAVIDLAELYRFVQDKVKEHAKDRGGPSQQPVWSFEHLEGIPTVMQLQRPDKPSAIVAIRRFPLPPTEDVMETMLDTISRFPRANPRNGIGMGKWVLANTPPNSALAKKAQAYINQIDELLLKGEISLEDGDNE